MHLEFDNVNDAFSRLVVQARTLGKPEASRNGPVLRYCSPSIITYRLPIERVLFNEGRDANPFFHLYEALWMLAGRNTVGDLAYFSSQIGQFSDDDITLNGAYGKRWRYSKLTADYPSNTRNKYGISCVDQLTILLTHLRDNPSSRRAVLGMWNTTQDLLRIDSQFGDFSKDVCCNLAVNFSIEKPGTEEAKLNMTVFNRSNDIVLGMFGANLVHFSVLQEYMAACLRVEVGVYNQISDNLHMYVDSKDKGYDKWVAGDKNVPKIYPTKMGKGTYPIFKANIPWETIFHREVFLDELDNLLNLLVDSYELTLPTVEDKVKGICYYLSEHFVHLTLLPMFQAFAYHKLRNYPKALEYANKIVSADWYTVCVRWITKRKNTWENKNYGEPNA